MLLIRAMGLLACLLCLAACAGDAGSAEGTDAFVHRQLDRRGL